MRKNISSTSRLTGALFLSASIFMASCGKDDDPVQAPNTVVNVATTNGFSTLVSALGTAGLTSTLNGAGPFTVFAPSNAAFSAITVPSDPTVLGNILKYH